jgi:hypothetical protein
MLQRLTHIKAVFVEWQKSPAETIFKLLFHWVFVSLSGSALSKYFATAPPGSRRVTLAHSRT